MKLSVIISTATLLLFCANHCESAVLMPYYGIQCTDMKTKEQYYCNMLIGWCNLGLEWDKSWISNFECCFEKKDDAPIDENLRKMVYDCAARCPGVYRHVDCSGLFPVISEGKLVDSDGMGNLTVIELPAV